MVDIYLPLIDFSNQWLHIKIIVRPIILLVSIPHFGFVALKS